MKINSLTLTTGNKVLLMEDFLEPALMEQVLALCDTCDTNADWEDAEWTKLRKIYKGDANVYRDLITALASADIRAPIEQALGKTVRFTDASLWADYPGFGPLLPHVEQHGEGQAQVYFTRKEFPTNGTSIMNLDKQLLFTLPYRNNYGWFFDECTQVMHSREFDVPRDIIRFSLIFWYSYD